MLFNLLERITFSQSGGWGHGKQIWRSSQSIDIRESLRSTISLQNHPHSGRVFIENYEVFCSNQWFLACVKIFCLVNYSCVDAVIFLNSARILYDDTTKQKQFGSWQYVIYLAQTMLSGLCLDFSQLLDFLVLTQFCS